MFSLPALEYDYDALAPAITGDTMRLHHGKHHQAYVDKLNAVLDETPDLRDMSIDRLIGVLDDVPASVRDAVRNNGGGHYNHSLFWQWMSPDGGGEPSEKLAWAITARYGSFQAFVDEFTMKSTGLFGSGWTWLMPDMEIITTQNQDNPIMKGNPTPILGLDVWEHAYYLDYKNVRAEYVKAWWDVVDWTRVQDLYQASLQ